jgi:hypothetical protein
MVKKFNDKISRKLLTVSSVKTNRDDIRAIVFYGQPKKIDNLYKESMKLGGDGRPSKSIVLWRALDDVRIQRVNLKCNKWGNLKDYKENNQYCISLLEKMTEYCETNLCRRSMIKKYFNIDNEGEIYRDTCCDNCQKIIYDKVAPSVLFKGVNKFNMIDITNEARTFLKCYKDCDCNILECKAILVGRAIKFQKSRQMEFFNAGRHKPEGFWILIYQRLIERGYIRESINKITRQGNRFIRCNTIALDMLVRPNVKCYLEKKNIHVTLQNEKVSTSLKEKVVNEDENEKNQKSRIFRPETLKRSSDDNIFDFESVTKPMLKRSKKVEVVKEKTPPPEPPKIDWREAFAALVSRKDHEDIFKPVESPKVNEQGMSSNSHQAVKDDIPQPSCSHHLPTAAKTAGFESLNSEEKEEEDADEEYQENMRHIRKLMHKPLTMPLDDLLDFIESYTFDKDKEHV